MNRRAVLGSTAGLAALAGCIFDDSGPDHEFERGELDVVIDGEAFDLSADRFQAEHADNYSMHFHLHEGGDYWYNDYPESGERITVAEGIDLLPHFVYAAEDDEHVVTIDGTEYDGRESGTELTFFVDDNRVDPTAHEIQDGDALRLEIETEVEPDA